MIIRPEQKQELAQNMQIYIFVDNKVYKYDIFAGYMTYNYCYNVVDFPDNYLHGFSGFMESRRNMDVLGATANNDTGRIISLVTPTLSTPYPQESGRYVLQGVFNSSMDFTNRILENDSSFIVENGDFEYIEEMHPYTLDYKLGKTGNGILFLPRLNIAE